MSFNYAFLYWLYFFGKKASPSESLHFMYKYTYVYKYTYALLYAAQHSRQCSEVCTAAPSFSPFSYSSVLSPVYQCFIFFFSMYMLRLVCNVYYTCIAKAKLYSLLPGIYTHTHTRFICVMHVEGVSVQQQD